jgi:hypothetical protein
MNKQFKDANKVINDFNQAIVDLKESRQYAELMQTDLDRKSLLDPLIYTDILRKW